MHGLPIKEDTQTLSIMVIDDSASERSLLQAMLHWLGNQVLELNSGLKAIKYLATNPGTIDLIILDVLMPGIDGYETARRIRKLEAEQNEEWCPIIFLSGRCGSEYIAHGIDAGGDDYLTKPVDATILKAKITAMQRIANMRKKLVAAKQQLEILAHTDELTQLPNRRRFKAILESEMARSRRHNIPLSLAYMDLDFFKNINDTHGHEAGDIVLQSIASLFTYSLRTEDSIGRVGGEEFCICLPGNDSAHSIEPCERYRSIIEKMPIKIESKTITITASFGLTSFLPNSDDATDLMARADKALYKAKQRGRNCVNVI